MTKQFFTINEAAKLLGVSIKTLRRWETKGLIAPIRTVGNQRRYEVEAIYALTGKKSKTATRKEAIKQTKHLSLSESALHLGISEKTLRRWEKKGIISSLKDKTNQKMFLFKDLEGLKETKEQVSFPVIASVPKQSQVDRRDRHIADPDLIGADSPRDDNKYTFSPQFVHFPTRFALITIGLFASIIVLGTTGGFLALKHMPIDEILAYLPFMEKSKTADKNENQVLQAATQARDFALRINIPVEMLQTASIAGNLTAPNILYSVVAGDNITVTGDPQNPVISAVVEDLEAFGFVAGEGIAFDGTTITNTAPSTNQNTFNNIKVGSTTISAGSNTDTFELAAGSNVSLSTDTSNKKITISSSGGGSGISGITVEEGDTTVNTATVLDFLGGDFDVGESPSGETNIQLASTLTSVTGVAGNFSIGGTTTLNSVDYTWPGSQGANYILQTDGSGTLSWIDSSSLPDIGDVVGPASATDNALVRFDGATGKLIQNSGVIIDDSNNVTGINSLTTAPASDITGLTLTGTNTTSQNLAYFNANNASGTIVDISYGGTQTLTGALIGQLIDLNNGQVTATNFDVTGSQITLPTVTNTNAAGTVNLRGLQVNFGSGAGINQNGAGATVFSNLDVQLPALTQTQGSLTANGLAVTTPSSITTGGTANGLLISPTGVGAGTLHGVNIATISASGAGNETSIHVGSGWDTVLRVNGTPVINGQGVTLATGGGTGQSGYAVGDILYANSTNTLTKLAIGGTDDYVLKVSSGVPVWGTVAGDSCSTCVITDPSSSATNTITPTGQSTTGLIVRQTSTASPTNDIFQVTDSSGSNVYFRIDENGNVYPSSAIGDTLTLTPNTDTPALTLVGTNVTTANLQYINANNQQGTIFNLAYGASQTLSTTTALVGAGINLGTNITATNATVTGAALTLPSTTNTNTSGTESLTGVSVSAAGGLNQNGAGGTTTFTAFDGTIPALTETAGTLNGYGVNVNTPSSITTGGTAAALNVTASGVGAGSLYGLNISGITAGAGTETALNIGSGWDSILSLNGTQLIDGSGNFNLSNATGVLPVENGGSPFEQAEGAIFPRIVTQDLLIGGTATTSATFHVWGSANGSATPVASISGNTSDTTFIVDNSGSGDLFSAASSGLERFVIAQNGNVGIGTADPSQMLDITGGAIKVTGNTGTAIADTFTGTTQQSYIHFPQVSGSNDPGFIMHETQGSGDTNEGVIHLSPSDDNGFGDYVSIHGTNDADTLKLHTDGTIEGVNDLFVTGQVGIGTSTLQESLNISGNIDLNSGELYLNNAAGTIHGFGYNVEGGSETTIFTDQFLDFTESDSDSIVMRLDANNGNLAIGTTTISERLTISGGAIGGNTAFLPLYASWNAYGTGDGGAGIYNDNGSFDTFMIVGSNVAGGDRTIGLWDTVKINGSSGYPLFVDQTNGGAAGIRVQIDTTGNPGNFMLFQSINVGGSDYTNGWIAGCCGGGTTYASASDIRLKDNITDTQYGINDLMNVQVADFNYINDPNAKTTGFLAQQLYGIYPPAVYAGTTGDDLSQPWGVDHGKLTPLIIKSVQDQQGQIEALKEQVDNIIAGSLDTESLTVNNLQTQTLSLAGQDLSTKLLGLESGIASTSASFTAPLATQMASLSSNLIGVSGQVTSLSDKVASLEAQISLISQMSPIGGFNASSSAQLSLESLEVNGNILTDSLNVLGYTTINELSVTGSIRTGVLTINGQTSGGASISTLNGDLKLQDQGFGGIDILDGLVTIDTDGNIETQGTITAKKFNIDTTSVSGASAGQIIMPIGVTSYDINTIALTPDSLIFVTPNKAVVVGAEPKDANTFTIRLQSAQTLPIKVNWWIVN